MRIITVAAACFFVSTLLLLPGCMHKENAPDAPVANGTSAPAHPSPVLSQPVPPPPSTPAFNVPLGKKSAAAHLGHPNDLIARCHDSDSVSWWENAYCIRESGANDVTSEAFKKCAKENFRGKKLPKKRCDRIQVLKMMTCTEGPEPLTRKNCLQHEDFQKMADDNSEMFFGG